MDRLRLAQVVALALLLAGCAQPGRETVSEPMPVSTRAPENFPFKDYERAAAQGGAVYRVDAARSLLVITVRRGGSLARFGHDHVVASHGMQGLIAPGDGRADLYVPLGELSVDEPALRAEAGLDTQPSASDIAGTRVNMLDKVLETQKFPYALIRVAGVEKAPPGVRLNVAITLRGVTRTFAVPTQIDAGRDDMEVVGSFEFNQSDFGIVPLSILGGAVQVQDGLSLRFMVRAGRRGGAADPSG